MKNAIKFLSLCCLALGMTIFVSCGNDDTTLPDEVDCDSLSAQINYYTDSLNLVLSVETFGYTGSLNYAWSNGETSPTIVVPLDDEGTYTVTVTADDEPDCEATGSIDLTNPVNCNLSTSISVSGNSMPNATLSANNNGGTAPFTYIWTTGATTASIDVSEDGTYGVSVSDANGCAAIADYNYTVQQVNPCDTNFYVSISGVESNDLITLSPTTELGIEPFEYSWSTGDTNSSITVSATTNANYYLTVTDATGCTTWNNYYVNYTDPCEDFFTVIYLNLDTLGSGLDYLNARPFNGSFPNTYYWSNGETEGAIEVTGDAPGTSYSVTVTDSNGCIAEDEYEL